MKKEQLMELGLTEEQATKVIAIHKETLDGNFVSKDRFNEVNEAKNNLDKQLKERDGQLEALKKSSGDNEELKNQIASLQKENEDTKKRYEEQIADRDFQDMLKESIAGMNGKNAKAITALLDLDTLKASKNQKEDIAAALKSLTEAEDSKMLFGEPEPNPVGRGNLIGQVKKPESNTEDAAMRAAMGLPPVAEQK